MGIKKLRFSFDIPIADVLGLVAMRNDSLQIDVIGDGKDDKIPKQLRNGVAGLLTGPKKKERNGTAAHGVHKVRGVDKDGKPITGYLTIAKAMLAADNHTVTTAGLKEPLTAAGLNWKSASPQLSIMVKDGDAKRVGFGAVKMTPQGARTFTKLLKERDDKHAVTP
jgi:hypothetical protein